MALEQKVTFVVVWVGIKYVRRDETQKGLCHIRSLVEKGSQTNILVMNVTYRFDLDAQSCVNHEVKLFNKNLGKHMNILHNATSV